MAAKSAVGDRVLVVMEDEGHRGDYAQLWKDLEGEIRVHYMESL